MAIIKYRTYVFLHTIDAVEITRETKKYVFFTDFAGRNLKAPKESSHTIYHDSWQKAHAHLVARTEKEIRHAKAKLDQQEKWLKTILSMKPES